MHKILVSGYYGFGNIGDESILSALVENLRHAGSDIEITVLSANPSFTESRHEVGAVDRKNFFEIYMAIKNCDLFISGGGGLLQDVTSEKSIRYYLGLIYIATRLNKKVMMYGQGIGPITKRANRALTKSILNRVNAITVRDEQSVEDLKSMGVSRPPIYMTSDPVVTLKPPGTSGGMGIIDSLGIQKDCPVVGFSVRDWKDAEGFYEIMARTADNLIEELGFQVVFVPFHYGEDNKCIMKIKSIMKNDVYSVDGRHSPGEVLDLIGRMDLTVGVRLHSLIFSAIQGVPLVGISYDPKIDGFLSRLGMRAVGSVSDLDLSDLLVEIQRVWSEREKVRVQILAKMEEMKEQAVINDKLVMELLNI
ncbi:MAG: polysaccharide pyruvyl transferase CsaB [Bacillota bacterium]|nr:polysaccharide pyruvyl transferase CsaB [Bacillota bacterium]MDD3298385.1 polysaccharide pyruvyl transferase CsaB [Bacillota bacterium]MDD3850694.1 polysaccharide pyruvyl transferase CsaB [Bacillota bacterium]MDD4707915.1 polysaccharide pyruvyl transferase CsaB [Bacillota bacterium]